MTDREKVVKALKCCKEGSCPFCPYYDEALGGGCGMYDDALELLEPVEPIEERLNEIDCIYRCGNCKTHFYYRQQKYCAICGRAVKWEYERSIG